MKQARRLGSYIEELSIRNNITPIQLSERLNCSERFIQRLLKGRAFLTFPKMKLLADTLGTTVGDLLDDSNYSYDENREMILDIIDDYMDLYEAVEVVKNNGFT